MIKKNNVRLGSLILLVSVLVSACTQSYSQAPAATPTLIPAGLFVSPFPSGQDPMAIIAELGTQTAMASTAQVTVTGTPPTATSTPIGGIVITPLTGASFTPTATINIFATTAVPLTVTPGGPTVTPQPTIIVPTVPGGVPASYTLQSGEFPYCIARRYNLNPSDLLSLNNIDDGVIFMPGLTLQLPQGGSWPGNRALHPHPDTYTVTGNGDTTLYGVACYYGDIFPQSIAQANNIALSTALTAGQQLSIP
jgi:LysM repeat protein